MLSLVPPLILPEDKQVTRWHPSFKLDQIPEIVPAEGVLPNKPATEKASSARDVIAKAQNILENGNSKMKQAMQNMLKNQDASSESTAASAEMKPKPKSAATIKSLKGVSSSLLEKVTLIC